MVHCPFADDFLRREPAAPLSPKRSCSSKRIEKNSEAAPQLIEDPGLRTLLSDFNQNTQNIIRHEYLIRGRTTPILKGVPEDAVWRT